MSDVTIFKAPAPVDAEEIRRLAVPILERYGVVSAFLIGSYARGSADAWSDVDVVVVRPSARPFVERPLELTELLDALPVAIDLLVYTPGEFERGMERGFGIFDVIGKEGVRIL